MSNSRLVYSTDDGDRRRAPGRRAPEEPTAPRLPDDGIVRVFREKGGRGGKTVTVVRGLPGGDLQAVASDAVKATAVELQGDHREKVAARLETKGYRVKLAGG
jgi:translation initiation factor 1